MARQYGYTVTYSGVGSGPPGTEHLGHCSQMAVFVKKSTETDTDNTAISTEECQQPYKLVREHL